MNHILTQQLKQLLPQPGVYEFFDTTDKLLYVGKAKSLRRRVRSYFQTGADLSPSKRIMIGEVHHLAYTQVTNEAEALLLEGNLIKQHLPPYNVVLKDDKSWLYIAIDYREPYPRITVERRINTSGARPPTKGSSASGGRNDIAKTKIHANKRLRRGFGGRVKYFGPYPAASIARDSLRLLKKVLALRTCKNPPNKPCFDSSLGRCLGHDLGRGSQRRYRTQLKFFEHVLRGNVRELVRELGGRMASAAVQRQFELAAKLRDQRQALERLAVRQNVLSASRESYDVFGLALGSTSTAVCRVPVRHGVMLEPERYLTEHATVLTPAEALSGFLEQYYPQAQGRPPQAYLPFKLEISSLLGIKFSIPARGKKRSLLKLADAAASAHLTGSAASWERKQSRASAGLIELKTQLNLNTLPRRIEGYDISNIQGKDAVGALVVLKDGVPDSSHYRKFRIQGPEQPNDFAMLAQVLVRRFTKNKDWPKPDLVMLDGGAGQLSAVTRALKDAGITIPLVALAKREEELYLPGRDKPLKLPHTNPGLLLLMELRDEAHRFGITFYRSRHRRAGITSAWDELPGVGPATKRKLKAAFGSLMRLRQATPQELTAIVGTKLAQVIKTKLG